MKKFNDFVGEGHGAPFYDGGKFRVKKPSSGRGQAGAIAATDAKKRYEAEVERNKHALSKLKTVKENFSGDGDSEDSEAKVRSSKSAAAGIVRKLKSGKHTPEQKKKLMHDFHMHMATVTSGMGLKMKAQEHREKQKKYQ